MALVVIEESFLDDDEDDWKFVPTTK